jgi:hypothetical protein
MMSRMKLDRGASLIAPILSAGRKDAPLPPADFARSGRAIFFGLTRSEQASQGRPDGSRKALEAGDFDSLAGANSSSRDTI